MSKTSASFRARLMGGAAAAVLTMSGGAAAAQEMAKFDIAPQPLSEALRQFGYQSGHDVLASPALANAKVSPGVAGEQDVEVALNQLLDGSGLTWKRNGNTFLIVSASDPQSGSAAGDGAEGTVQALVVTAQKREENIQDVPIAMSAFTQEDLTRSQVAGGPDLMTQVPNFTFTKTNFSGYSIQIRGIGTQAISATTDPAVAVAFNNTPFVRNRFFEQEFYDLQRVEVLRGPQGTLYGRNATAGVVNIISQKPKFAYEAKIAADVANYGSSRIEGMLNVPLVDDKVALRLAGAWTKRDGYTVNTLQDRPTDGRNLWSTRLSLRVAPTDAIEANLIWEHFEEDDDRLRSGKQLCHRDHRTEIAGHPVAFESGYYYQPFSQGCLPASLYGQESYQAPYGPSLPYKYGVDGLLDPYASTTQSSNLREIETVLDPIYRAKSDLAELQFSVDLTDALTLSSETAYSADEIFSFEDYNRFAPTRGIFPAFNSRPGETRDGPFGPEFCDPQLGCADHLVAGDLSTARSRQFSQELRLASDFDGPLNFSLGGNFLRYDTMEKYYVFINMLTIRAVDTFPGPPWPYNRGDNYECLPRGMEPPVFERAYQVLSCTYIDPNPITSLNDQGHNYFLSKNPYKLLSYAAFGEIYYDLTDSLKLTAGLRWTVDKKEAPRIPSWILASFTAGSQVAGVERQQWREPTGRLTLDWKPDLGFTDDTLLYLSLAHGYKAGGANPPPAGVVAYGNVGDLVLPGKASDRATHPLTFRPEFVNALELGTKNTLFDSALTLNGTVFYYDYTDYQTSQIIDRSAVNYNFDARIWGVEIETAWRPLENLRLTFKGGYENTRIANGMTAIDVMDRTAGHDDWMIVKPYPTFPSNCIVPVYSMVAADGYIRIPPALLVNGDMGPCEYAYVFGRDPTTQEPYVPFPSRNSWFYPPNFPGYDPTTAPNDGEGFEKQLGGNELPNAPHFTASVTGDYTIPLPSDWLMTLHTDLYYQSEAWTRVFNTPGYDKLKAYTNVNVAAIFANEDAGWQVMAYVKNVFDRDNITGAFLNSDDSGLTTNVFLSEPRLYGLRVTKNWNGSAWWTGAGTRHAGPYPLTIEIGGQVQRQDAPYERISPPFVAAFSDGVDPTVTQNRDLDWGDGRQVAVVFRPSAGPFWLSAGLRNGRANTSTRLHRAEVGDVGCKVPASFCDMDAKYIAKALDWSDSTVSSREDHTLADFKVGRDFGIGAGGLSRSSISGGLRYADFGSATSVWMEGIPDLEVPDEWVAKYASTWHRYTATLDANRQFKGAGPVLTWEAGKSLLGNDEVGRLGIDWSVTAGVLFGKQKTHIAGTENGAAFNQKYNQYLLALIQSDPTPIDIKRSSSVTVPVADIELGLSYEIQRVKLGAGYRWERYFNVLDAGYDKARDADRTIDGPYFKIAVGFGG